MSHERLQRIGKYTTTLAHRKRGGWELLTMAKDAAGKAKEKLNGEYRNGFEKWYRTVSLELIGGLLIILVTILISVIGWNYLCDDRAHSCYVQSIAETNAKIAELDKNKIEFPALQYESALIRADIAKLSRAHEDDVARITSKLDASMNEIKRILMKKYAQ